MFVIMWVSYREAFRICFLHAAFCSLSQKRPACLRKTTQCWGFSVTAWLKIKLVPKKMLTAWQGSCRLLSVVESQQRTKCVVACALNNDKDQNESKPKRQCDWFYCLLQCVASISASQSLIECNHCSRPTDALSDNGRQRLVCIGIQPYLI